MKPKISIVVPTYKREEPFKKLINSITNSNCEYSDYEIVVVSSDERDSDKILWLQEKKDLDVNLILESDRSTSRVRTLAYYENLGIKNSKYDWILVCNDDMWFETDWYTSFMECINESKVYLISSHIGDIGLGLRIPSIGTLFYGDDEKPLWLYDMTIIHKSIYEKVNYLDENINWYGKGADLSIAVAFLTDEFPSLCYNVKINHDIVSELRNENKSPCDEDFDYIRKKWNKWIIDNKSEKKYIWI